ncbi:MAG: glycine cleavage system protein GcvH [Armatimonadetes bacterium]|nr:glycine cleavage system protein GcvH [Armatimonadota bacterium]
MYPDDLKYTEEHEWVRLDGDVATVGITHFAQDQLGDIVDVDLPEVGAQVACMKECGAIESVKTASDLFSPVTGQVTERNITLASRIDGQKNPDFHPELVNQDPYSGGWLFKVKLADVGEVGKLLDAAAYRKLVE